MKKYLVEFGYNELVGPDLTDTRWQLLDRVVIEAGEDEAAFATLKDLVARLREVVAGNHLCHTGDDLEKDDVVAYVSDLDKDISQWEQCGAELVKELNDYENQQ